MFWKILKFIETRLSRNLLNIKAVCYPSLSSWRSRVGTRAVSSKRPKHKRHSVDQCCFALTVLSCLNESPLKILCTQGLDGSGRVNIGNTRWWRKISNRSAVSSAFQLRNCSLAFMSSGRQLVGRSPGHQENNPFSLLRTQKSCGPFNGQNPLGA